MEPTVISIVFDDQGTTAVLDRYVETLQQIEIQANRVSKAQEQSANQFKEQATAATESEKALDMQVSTTMDSANTQNLLNRSLADGVRDFRIYGVSIGQVEQQIRKWVTILRSSTQITKTQREGIDRITNSLAGYSRTQRLANAGSTLFARGIRLVSAAFKAIPIIALIAALAGLVSFLTRTQRGSEFLSIAMAQVGAAIAVVTDRLAIVGEAIIQIFQGNFAEAAETARGAFEGLSEEIRETTDLAGQLRANLIEIQKEAVLLRAVNAQRRIDLAEQKQLSEDTTRSDTERIMAARAAAEISREIIADEIALGERRLANLAGQVQVNETSLELTRRLRAGAIEANEAIESLGITSSQLDDLSEYVDVVEELADRQLQQTEVQTTLQNSLNTIEDQRRAKIEAQVKEQQRLTAELQKQLQTIDNLITDITLEELEQQNYPEYLRTVAQLERDRINAIFDSAEAAAEAANMEIDISEERAVALARIERNLNEELDSIRRSDIAPLEVISPADLEQISVNADDISERIRESIAEGTEDVKQEAFNLRNKLIEALGIEPGSREADFIISSFNTLFDGIQETINFRSDRLIAEQDSIIDAASERLDELQERLDDQRAEQDAGRANDVASLERAVLTEEAVLTAAEERRAALQQAAARRQLIIESSLQAAGIVTTGINVLKNATASRGLIGAALGIAFIATLIPLFAGLRAQATEATQLREGGKLDGPSHEGGGIDILRPGESRPTYNAEGGEWVINKGASSEHDTFLRDINANKYRGVDLSKMAAVYKSSPLGGRRRDISIPATPQKRYTESDVIAAVDKAIKEQTKEIKKMMAARPIPVTDQKDFMYVTNQGTKTVKK